MLECCKSLTRIHPSSPRRNASLQPRGATSLPTLPAGEKAGLTLPYPDCQLTPPPPPPVLGSKLHFCPPLYPASPIQHLLMVLCGKLSRCFFRNNPNYGFLNPCHILHSRHSFQTFVQTALLPSLPPILFVVGDSTFRVSSLHLSSGLSEGR